jgi:hypothetical protein
MASHFTILSSDHQNQTTLIFTITHSYMHWCVCVCIYIYIYIERERERERESRAVNEPSLGEPGLSKLAYLKISRARARAELFAELKI